MEAKLEQLKIDEPLVELVQQQASEGPKDPDQVSFNALCLIFEGLANAHKFKGKSAQTKRQYLDFLCNKLVDRKSGHAFNLFRLVIPQLDFERNYKLQDTKLLDVIFKIYGISTKSELGKRLKRWKSPLDNENAGDFIQTMEQEVFIRACGISNPKLLGNSNIPKMTGLPPAHIAKLRQVTVKEINERLDELAANAGKTEAQAEVLRKLKDRLAPFHMKWLLQIILKKLRMNTSEKAIFKMYHADAEDYYNNSGMDLKSVFNDMQDKNVPHATNIAPGKLVKPQLTTAVYSEAEAFKRLVSADGTTVAPFIVETKFDGERVQIHRCPEGSICYYSRKGLEHSQRYRFNVMDQVITEATGSHNKIILDGELLVWDDKRKRFEPFGSLKAATAAASSPEIDPKSTLEVRTTAGDLLVSEVDPEYHPPMVEDIVIVYVVFDIIYVDTDGTGGSAVNTKPLSERLQILKDTVKDVTLPILGGHVRGRVLPILPDETRLDNRLCSIHASTQEEIKQQLDNAIALKEEGIVIKNLNSQWLADNRSNTWLKLKPEYAYSQDIDVVILGGFYGSGRRGGIVSQYLLGLRDNDRPGCWITFGRVGSGASDEERQAIYDLLKQGAGLGEDKGQPPDCVRCSGEEKPDVWVKDPSKSVVLSIKSDIRHIVSRTYATNYSVRFPRIVSIRDDKLPADIDKESDVAQFVAQIVEKGIETADAAVDPTGNMKKKRAGRRKAQTTSRKVGQIASRFLTTNVKSIPVESDVLQGCNIYICNFDDTVLDKHTADIGIRKLGGRRFAAYCPAITHIVAHHTDGTADKHIKQGRSIISLEWLKQCIDTASKVPLRPSMYLYMSSSRRHGIDTEADATDVYGDSFTEDSTAADIKVLLQAMRANEINVAELYNYMLAMNNVVDGSLLSSDVVAAIHRVAAPEPNKPVVALQMYLDEQQKLLHVLDKHSALFRGCNSVVLGLDSSTSIKNDEEEEKLLLSSTAAAVNAVSTGAPTLLKLEVEQLKLDILLHGGKISSVFAGGVTHMMGVTTAVDDQQLEPEVLLQTVKDQAGGEYGVRALESILQTKAKDKSTLPALVTSQWVVDSITFESQQQEGLYDLEAFIPALGDAYSSVEEVKKWPWDRYRQHLPSAPAGGGRAGRATAAGPPPRAKKQRKVISSEDEDASMRGSVARVGGGSNTTSAMEVEEEAAPRPIKRRGRALLNTKKKKEASAEIVSLVDDDTMDVDTSSVVPSQPAVEEPQQQQQQPQPPVVVEPLVPSLGLFDDIFGAAPDLPAPLPVVDAPISIQAPSAPVQVAEQQQQQPVKEEEEAADPTVPPKPRGALSLRERMAMFKK